MIHAKASSFSCVSDTFYPPNYAIFEHDLTKLKVKNINSKYNYNSRLSCAADRGNMICELPFQIATKHHFQLPPQIRSNFPFIGHFVCLPSRFVYDWHRDGT